MSSIDLTEIEDEDIIDWQKKINPFSVLGYLHGSCYHFENLHTSERFGEFGQEQAGSQLTRSGDGNIPIVYPTRSTSDYEENDSPGEVSYHVEFFNLIIQNVQEKKGFASLFTNTEQGEIRKYESLSCGTQELYIRVFYRKRCWFRESKISYVGIDNKSSIQCLFEKGFFKNESALTDITEALELLSVTEIKKLAVDFKIGKQYTTKASILSYLKKSCKNQKTIFGVKKSMDSVVLERVKKMLGICVKINEDIAFIFEKMILLFQMFSNLPTDGSLLYHLLQVKIKQIVYPSFNFENCDYTTMFKNRQEFLAYMEVKDLETQFFHYVENADLNRGKELFETAFKKLKEMISKKIHERLSLYRRQWSAFYVLARICRNAISLLEKLKFHQEAVDVIRLLLSLTCLRPKHRGMLWERLIIDTGRHLRQTEQALIYNQDAIEDKSVRGHYLYSLKKRLEKSSVKKKKLESAEEFELPYFKQVKVELLKGAAVLDTTSSNRAVFMSPKASGSIMSNVEQFVIEHYKDQGYLGVHDEGTVTILLYFLLFWDIIFKNTPSQFLNKYQTEPLDFRTDDFYTNRKKELDERINFVYHAPKKDLRKELERSWDAHCGCYVFGVNWSIVTKSEAVDIAISIQPLVLGGICEMYSKDLASRRSGFPDLILWKKEEHTCKIIEVKGPGDKLSSNQIVWLDILQYLGANVGVCHVTGVGGKRKFIRDDNDRHLPSSLTL